MLKESRALHIVQYPSCTCEVTWCSAAVVSYKRSKTKIKRVASFFIVLSKSPLYVILEKLVCLL